MSGLFVDPIIPSGPCPFLIHVVYIPISDLRRNEYVHLDINIFSEQVHADCDLKFNIHIFVMKKSAYHIPFQMPVLR